jgi:hypothetical protein
MFLGLNDVAFLAAAAGGAALWTPADITTALWLDAADASTITLESGAVSQWNDKSGNGRNFAQSASGNRPTYASTGLNGKPTLAFDTNDFMELSSGLISNLFTIVAVANANTLNVNGGLFAGRSKTNTAPVHQFDRESTNARIVYRGDAAGPVAAAGQGTLTFADYIVACSQSSTLLGLSLNGNNLTTVAASNVAATLSIDVYTVGAFFPGSLIVQSFHNGDISEIVYVAGQPSTDTRQRIEGYLAHKWGLTANLPNDHPYKTAAPTL